VNNFFAIIFLGAFMLIDKNKVLKIISKSFGVDEINLNTLFLEDLGVEYVDLVLLIIALEDAYEISISDEDAQKFTSPQDVVTYLEEHVIPPNSLE
jgi:acyl carrier protein